jgi:MFS family permease
MSPSESTPNAGLRAGAGNRRWLRVLYVLVALLFWISLYIYLPTLPTYIESKSGSLAVVGVVLAQYGLWQAIIRFPVGIAADWLGRRKPFILVGIALAGLGAWVMGSAQGTSGLFAGRAITGLAAGTWVPLTVAFSTLFPPQQAIRASAILAFVASAGKVIGTSINGPLHKFGGYLLVFNGAVLLAALSLLIALPIREKGHPPRRPSFGFIGRLISRRDVLMPSLLSALLHYADWAFTFGFIPILAESLGASSLTLSLLVSLHIALMTVMSLVTAAIAERVGARRLAGITFLLQSAGIGLAAVAPSLTLVFVAQFALGVAQGLGYSVLMGLSIRDVDDSERTTAMGLHQSVYALGMFAGPWLSGLLADALGLRPMFGVTAAAFLVVPLALVRLLPPRCPPVSPR